MEKTLQDFVLCNVSEDEARAFYKVLSKHPLVANKYDDFSGLLKKYYNSHHNGWTWHKLFGDDVDPFDLTPEELKKLNQVTRDPAMQVEFIYDLKVNSEAELTKVQRTVNQFVLDNSVFLESLKDIYVDTLHENLVFSGHVQLAEDLLKLLKVPPVDIKKILSGKLGKLRYDLYIPYTEFIKYLEDKASKEEFRKRSWDMLNNYVAHFKKQFPSSDYQLEVTKVKDEHEKEHIDLTDKGDKKKVAKPPKKWGISYEGPYPYLREFCEAWSPALSKSMLKDIVRFKV